MRKSVKNPIKFLNILYKILPFFLGIYCYYPVFKLDKNRIYPFLDSIYSSLKLYSANTESGVAVGGLLQFARFLALAATLSILINAFNKMNALINQIKLFNRNSTVVYGDSVCAEYFFEDLSRRIRIRGEEKMIKNASRYLLMFSNDAANIEFYNRNYKFLKDKRVYIMLENTSRQNIENPLITVFSITENCARQYWRNYPVERNEKIAIVGFENVGKNILTYGLLVNIIDPGQHFEYHIYGNSSEFRNEHTELDKMLPDKIIFYDESICKYTDMTDFDRIIICGSNNDNMIQTVSKLIVYVPQCCQIHVYAPNGDVITNLFGHDRVKCFGMSKDVSSADAIFNESSMRAARKQHEDYVKRYGGVPWEKLDCFKRYSNVSSSDYMYVINSLLKNGVQLETIAELEHMRWCRYHYIHNWKYGETIDASKRTHKCLVPFEELSEAEKLKDIEAIKSKMCSDCG